MKRTNKAGDWQKLVVLTDDDLFGNPPKAGPAVKVTFARYGREVRYSHTAGMVDDDGQFRSVQHLHDRNLSSYIMLLQYTRAAVAVAKQLDPETVAEQSYNLKGALRKAMREAMDEVLEEPVPEQQSKQEKPKPITKPTLGATIGEMMKAKQNQG